MYNKYHKQKRSKVFVDQYKKISEAHDLGYKFKDDFDLIKVSVFETFLKQKSYFENAFETVRNDVFDMWEYLSFYEKNDLILLEVNKELEKLHMFMDEGVIIYMPYFDRLLNSLYATEIAILERPQFFKLYTDFKASCIDPEIYGVKPYVANFSYCTSIQHNERAAVLLDEDLKIFYRIGYNERRIPVSLRADLTPDHKAALSTLILNEQDDDLDAYVVAHRLVSKKFIKRYEKNEKRKLKKQGGKEK